MKTINTISASIIQGHFHKSDLMPPNCEWLNVDQAWRYLGLPSKGALYKMNSRKELIPHKVTKRRVRYLRIELDQFLMGKRVEAKHPPESNSGGGK